MDSEISFYYQAADYQKNAVYHALLQLRKHYKDEKVVIVEDGTHGLHKIADYFKCQYLCDSRQTGVKGRTSVGRDKTMIALQRVYIACKHFLDTEYVVFYEDDVYCNRRIRHKPKHDISGNKGAFYTNEMIEFWKNKFPDRTNIEWNSPTGSLETFMFGGGFIFKRNKYIEAYEKRSEINWDLIDKLGGVKTWKPSEWIDSGFCILMQHAGCTSGQWIDWENYDIKHSDRVPGSDTYAFLHLYKEEYNKHFNEKLIK